MTAISYALLGLVLVLGFGWYERTRPPARVVALVAAMAALAVAGRLAFAAVPNVKPTTDIVLFAGFALGGVPGFVVGAVTALASNVFFGQGPWTAWQMVAWGGVGVGGALLARVTRGGEPGRVRLAVACGVAGSAFGAFMDIYQWSFAAEQTAGSYAAVAATSLPYNLAHVIGNVGFALLIGPTFIRVLRRYRRRFAFSWDRPVAARLGSGLAAVLVAVAALGVVAAAPARAASPAAKATRYLERAQNQDGGLPASKGSASSSLFSGWAALGLASAGKNPRDVQVGGGRSLLTYLGRRSFGDTGSLERTILVVRSAGLSPRRFRGRNLVAALAARRRGDGSWAGNVAHTAFGMLALKAGGGGGLAASASYLGRAQNGDGGYGYVPSASSDVDDTGAALQAMVAAGRRGSAPVHRGVAFLRSLQNGDGGWGQTKGRSSNAQSTAWAVQGLVAAGVRVGSLKADPLRFIAGLQARDGHIRYSRTSNQTPVWVTAQALAALRRKPFPLGATPRRRRAAQRSPAAAPGHASAPAAGAKAGRAPALTAPGAVVPRTAVPTRKRRLEDERAQAAPTTRAKAVAEPSGGVPLTLLAAALLAALAALWLVRRTLRSRGLRLARWRGSAKLPDATDASHPVR